MGDMERGVEEHEDPGVAIFSFPFLPFILNILMLLILSAREVLLPELTNFLGSDTERSSSRRDVAESLVPSPLSIFGSSGVYLRVWVSETRVLELVEAREIGYWVYPEGEDHLFCDFGRGEESKMFLPVTRAEVGGACPGARSLCRRVERGGSFCFVEGNTTPRQNVATLYVVAMLMSDGH